MNLCWLCVCARACVVTVHNSSHRSDPHRAMHAPCQIHTHAHTLSLSLSDSSVRVRVRVARLEAIQLFSLPEWINEILQNQIWQSWQTDSYSLSVNDLIQIITVILDTAMIKLNYMWYMILFCSNYCFYAALLSDDEWLKGQQCAKLTVKGMWNSPKASLIVSHTLFVLALLFLWILWMLLVAP